jgi:hypothetical protein
LSEAQPISRTIAGSTSSGKAGVAGRPFPDQAGAIAATSVMRREYDRRYNPGIVGHYELVVPQRKSPAR